METVIITGNNYEHCRQLSEQFVELVKEEGLKVEKYNPSTFIVNGSRVKFVPATDPIQLRGIHGAKVHFDPFTFDSLPYNQKMELQELLMLAEAK